MICPKLDSGSCKLLKAFCPKKYKIKMVKHRLCPVFKGKKPKASKPSKPKVSKKHSKAKRRR